MISKRKKTALGKTHVTELHHLRPQPRQIEHADQNDAENVSLTCMAADEGICFAISDCTRVDPQLQRKERVGKMTTQLL